MNKTHDNTGIGRWGIAIAGTGLQLCLGTVYAWSYFQKMLVQTYGWTNTQVAWVFSLAICFLGLAAAWGGMNLAKWGPRRLATIGGALFATGYFVAALALHIRSLPLLYSGYGVLGGIGLGLGYVTPVATAAKWFPDKKGLVTGMVVMGFGFGALLMSKILVPAFTAFAGGNLVLVFACLGALFAVVTIGCGSLLHNPPADSSGSNPRAISDPTVPSYSAIFLSPRFLLIWTVFFCNIVAGIAIIGFQSPLLQDLLKLQNPTLPADALVSSGATLIAISSVFNGLGRFFWGGVSDRIGRTRTFHIILATQIAAFVALAKVCHPLVFAALVCYVLLCYGGGFGTMPSLVLDSYGQALMPLVYGTILTAWSAAGIAGPQIVAWLKDNHGTEAATIAFWISAGFLTVGLLCSLALSHMVGSATKLQLNS